MNDQRPLDRIHVRDLAARCIIGVADWEREKRQEIAISLTLHADLSGACRSDRIADTVDYKQLKGRLLAFVEDSEFQLIERLAEGIAELCLAEPRVQRVDVLVDKLGALRFARSVAVEITRTRSDGDQR
jgi:FolB domain-containing protein